MMTAIHLINHITANTSDPRIVKRFQIAEMHHYGSVADQVEKERVPRAFLPFVRHKLAANFRWRSVLHLGVATLKAWVERAGLQAAGR